MLYFFNHPQTNSVPVLPSIKGLSGLALHVKIILVYFLDNNFTASIAPLIGSP